jgi:hypothetical protein
MGWGMSWDREESLDRIQRRWQARDTEIVVSRLTREMDLENVTLANGRCIQGAHVYATVAGSGRLDCLDTDDDARSAIQRIALWQAEVARIAQAFEVPIIAFQGARVHLLAYRPIGDDQAISRKATLLSKAITYMTRDAFNPFFEDELQLDARAAADVGETVATRAGTRGDSELLFLGNAANRPAKLLGSAKLVVTGRFLEAIDGQIPHEYSEATEDDAWIVRMSVSAAEAAAAEDGIAWSVETSEARIAEDLEKWPVSRFKVSGASELIEPNDLSRSNSKLVTGAVLLMDIDGFSAYISQAEGDTVKRDAILTLDAIRQEMRAVLKTDYSGVRIHYQGDNMIGLVHLPPGDDEGIATTAAEIAAGMQDSMTQTLPEVVPDADALDVAVGVAMDDTVVGCLGQYAKRNALIIGPAATNAESIQMRLSGQQTGVDATTFHALPAEIQALYDWSASAQAYVATQLGAAKLSRVREALTAVGSRVVTPDDRGRLQVGAGAAVAGSAEYVRPFRPYAE